MMTKEAILKEVYAIMNSNENDIVLNFESERIAGTNYRVFFNSVVNGDTLDYVDEVGDDAYDSFDLKQIKEQVALYADQIETIMNDVTKFAKTNPTVGRWTKGGKLVKMDFEYAFPFRYEVTDRNIITVF